MNKNLEAQAERLDKIAEELERAAAHARTASAHFRAGEVPRGCAHKVALDGHLVSVKMLADEIAAVHSTQAVP